MLPLIARPIIDSVEAYPVGKGTYETVMKSKTVRSDKEDVLLNVTYGPSGPRAAQGNRI